MIYQSSPSVQCYKWCSGTVGGAVGVGVVMELSWGTTGYKKAINNNTRNETFICSLLAN
jgi:hypothetical protein